MSNDEVAKPRLRRNRPFHRSQENTFRFIRGSYANPDRETKKEMRELGDDLGLLARLERDLMRAWNPQDSMQALIVADVAKLYWKKTHLERTVVANRVSERRRVNETLTMHNADENSGDAPLDPVALSMGGYRSVPDSGEAYEESTHLLNRLLQWVEERDWTGDVAKITTLLYGEELPPHGREILDLYGSLANTESEMTDEDERTAAAQLRNVIMLEKASVLVAQTVFRVGRRDRVRLSLGSAWVPTSPNWDLMVAQDAHLDRMIESKIRLLIRLQGPEKGGRRAAAALGSGRETDDEDAIPVEAIIHRHPSATMVETGGDVPRSDGENAEKDPFEKLTVNVV